MDYVGYFAAVRSKIEKYLLGHCTEVGVDDGEGGPAPS